MLIMIVYYKEDAAVHLNNIFEYFYDTKSFRKSEHKLSYRVATTEVFQHQKPRCIFDD